MVSKRTRRVSKVKHGYAANKRSVRVPNDAVREDGLEKVVDRRVEMGYRKGYKHYVGGGFEEAGVGRIGMSTEFLDATQGQRTGTWSADMGDEVRGAAGRETSDLRRSKRRKGSKRSKQRASRGIRRVELGYTSVGGVVRPRISERKVRSQPSRPMRVSHKERWGICGSKGGIGHYRRETTAGRRTGEEARKKEVGGTRRLWVH